MAGFLKAGLQPLGFTSFLGNEALSSKSRAAEGIKLGWLSLEALFYTNTVFLALGTVIISVVFRDSPR